MTTSGVTDWELTALDIVTKAMGELSILDPSADPEGDEAAQCMDRLNGLLKSWAMQGVSLYRETTDTITTTPATASVTLADDVRSISTVRLVVSATNERRIWPVGRTEYFSIPNKTAAGSPTMFYLDRQRGAAVLYLWPVSATAVDLVIDYDRLPETVTELTETLDIRQELHEAVWTNLALRISGLFGVAIPPELAMRAARLEMQMFDAERPDSYRFETDYDYSYA